MDMSNEGLEVHHAEDAEFGPMASVIFVKLKQLRLLPENCDQVSIGRLLAVAPKAFATLVCRLCQEINLLSFRLGLAFVCDDSFQESLLSFLANFGREFLWDLEDVLDSPESRTYLLDFLASNLQLCRLERRQNRAANATPSSSASSVDPLVHSLARLGAAVRPQQLVTDPSSQTAQSIVQSLLPAMKNLVASTAGSRLVAPAAIPTLLAQFNDANEKLARYYEMRKQASLQRLDVTVKCFEWGAVASGTAEEFRRVCAEVGNVRSSKGLFSMYDLVLMDREMLRIVKVSKRSTAHAMAREYVLSAGVPDRGGRVGEGRLGKMPGFKPREELATPKKQNNYQPKKKAAGGGGGNASAANAVAAASPSRSNGGGGGGGGGGSGGGKKKKTGGNKVKGAWTEEKKRPNMASSNDKTDVKSSPKRPNNG